MNHQITVNADGHVLFIGVNRPEKLNASGSSMLEALSAAYQRLAEDDGTVGRGFHQKNKIGGMYECFGYRLIEKLSRSEDGQEQDCP